jgi:hypothetical protein
MATLARISYKLSTAAADPGMSTALRSVGRLVSMPIRTAWPRNLLRKAGWRSACISQTKRTPFGVLNVRFEKTISFGML